MVHLVDQALALFGSPTRVYAEFDRRRPDVLVDDDVFVALTHDDGVRSHLFASTTVGLLGPRFTVLGSRAAFVKHGMDPQEEALIADATPGGPGWGEEADTNRGRLGSGDAGQLVPSEPGLYQEFYRGVAVAITTAAPPPTTRARGSRSSRCSTPRVSQPPRAVSSTWPGVSMKVNFPTDRRHRHRSGVGSAAKSKVSLIRVCEARRSDGMTGTVAPGLSRRIAEAAVVVHT